MNRMPNETTIAVWTRLVRAHNAALNRVESDLKKAGLPPLGWYDALLELEKAGEEGLRPHELEGRLLLPQYGMSRLLARLAEAGYVEKRPCEEDGRGHVVSITKRGREVRRKSWPVYASAIQAAIGDKLPDEAPRALAALLERLVRRP